MQDPSGRLNTRGAGIVAATIGEGTADIDTPFLLVDTGRARLPALD